MSYAATAAARRKIDADEEQNDDRMQEIAMETPEFVARRILLIEDNKSDVVLVKRTLHEMMQGEDIKITDVPRLSDALGLLDYFPFDLVLLDLNLLDAAGVEAIDIVRAQVPDVPIIVYSGATDEKVREAALEHGASHYLIKGRTNPLSLRFTIHATLLHAQL